MNERFGHAIILGASLLLSSLGLGFIAQQTAIDIKEYERSVKVKGLAEREVKADIALWPIKYTQASNELSALYQKLERANMDIYAFLVDAGFEADEISLSAPHITDKWAQDYGDGSKATFRYTATQTLSLYTNKVDLVREKQAALSELGKTGLVFINDRYDNRIEYLFSGLNEIKPAMIEEATTKAREVADKFAQDSQSQLGKIKRASQGQFSINDRDSNTPYIKKVRVVTSVEYYLSD